MAEKFRLGGRFVSRKQFEEAANQQTMTGGHDRWDNRSHIERINHESDNPAHVPGQGVVHTPIREK